MKKSILSSLLVLASVAFLFAQQKQSSAAAPAAFTKKELFSFSDVKSLLSSVNKTKYSSLNVVRSFNLTFSATTTDANGNTVTTSSTSAAPDGVWTNEQKALIEQYGKKGVVFYIEGIIMGTYGEPGTPYVPDTPFSVPAISFSITE